MSLVVSEDPAPRIRRPLPVRAWRLVRRLVLRYQINETERWIKACANDGILDSVSLRYIRADLAQMRVTLATLED